MPWWLMLLWTWLKASLRRKVAEANYLADKAEEKVAHPSAVVTSTPSLKPDHRSDKERNKITFDRKWP